MAYNPQNSFRGDIYLKQGMDSISNTIGQLGDDLKKQKEEIKKREQEDKELSAKIKVMSGGNPVDQTGMTVDDKRGFYAGLLDKENSQVNQANIRQRDAVTKQILDGLKSESEANQQWQKVTENLLKDPNLTDRQRTIIGSGAPLSAAAMARLMEEGSNLTPSESISGYNAQLREREIEMKERDQAAADKDVEVTDIRPGLILINDKDGPRVERDPSFKQPVDPNSVREAQYLDGLIKDGKYEEAARYSNQVIGPKDELGSKWTAEDFKPKTAPASSETPKGKDYNIGGTSFKVLTR